MNILRNEMIKKITKISIITSVRIGHNPISPGIPRYLKPIYLEVKFFSSEGTEVAN